MEYFFGEGGGEERAEQNIKVSHSYILGERSLICLKNQHLHNKFSHHHILKRRGEGVTAPSGSALA